MAWVVAVGPASLCPGQSAPPPAGVGRVSEGLDFANGLFRARRFDLALEDVTKLPGAGLDGMLLLGDKLLVTSWKASAVFRGKLNDKFESVISNVNGPADLGYDSKRNRVLLPRFIDNLVEVYEIN